MKAFRFTLEAVRTLRQRRENETLEQYAQALVARQRVLDLLEAIDEKIVQSRGQLRKLLAEGCGADQAARAYAYHSAIEKRRDECVTTLGQAECRVNTASQAMRAARQEREIVDVHCEKQKGRHRRRESSEEQKLLDEFASRRAPSIQLNSTPAIHD